MIARLVAIALAALVLPGCLVPMIHPLRAETGPYVSLATAPAGLVPSATGCSVEGACSHGDRSEALWTPVAITGGYAYVLRERFGFMAGLSVPEWGNQQANDWYAPFALHTFFTLQNERASIGAGPEVGFGGYGMTVGGEVQPWGSRLWRPSVGAYVRLFFPFEETDDWYNGRSRSIEVGVRLGVKPAFVQYAFYQREHGAVAFGWSEFGSGAHLFAVGVVMDAAFWRTRGRGGARRGAR